ncbi:MAG: hypothetical protein M2R45_03889 [Verrucomicrobia subdivision 3 bacterium]|nr:hypothetical protein [Limisphaerales bacterium]MCS1412592.1 hypothetical protein [Limisphaerales bacterium]
MVVGKDGPTGRMSGASILRLLLLMWLLVLVAVCSLRAIGMATNLNLSKRKRMTSLCFLRDACRNTQRS